METKDAVSFYESKRKALAAVVDKLSDAQFILESLIEAERSAPAGDVDELNELWDMIGAAEDVADNLEDATQALLDMATDGSWKAVQE